MELVEITITHITGRRAGEIVSCRSWPATLGRAPSNAIQLATHDTRASAKHAELQFDGLHVYLVDLNSTNGTYLRGRRITRAKLASGDVVEFGIGGPQLRFDFIAKLTQPAIPIPAASPIPPTQIAAAIPTPPQVSISPLVNAQPIVEATRMPVLPAQPQFPVPAPMASPLPNQPSAPPQRVALGEDWAGNAPSQTTHFGNREFPLRNRNRYICYGIGWFLVLSGIALFMFNLLIFVPPSILMGFFLLLTGWSFSRVNITITDQGIEYQGLWRQYRILWNEVTELHAEKSKTRLLTDLVYTVRSPKRTITFSTSGYTGGIELAQLLTRRTGRRWE